MQKSETFPRPPSFLTPILVQGSPQGQSCVRSTPNSLTAVMLTVYHSERTDENQPRVETRGAESREVPSTELQSSYPRGALDGVSPSL